MTERDIWDSAPEGDKRRILIAQNDGDDRRFLVSALAGHYEVSTADTFGAALRQAGGKDGIALMLVSCSLPDTQVTDALKRLNEDPMLMQVPAAVIGTNREEEVLALGGGAIDFILLPCDQPNAVLARVRHALELSENRNIIRSTERDQLTGLYNKDFFFNYADQYDNYHRELEMDAIVVNITHFHMINERYGRSYGDDVLRMIGKRIRDYVSPDGGIVCRRDGDTFLVYCPHRMDYGEILQRASKDMDRRVHLRMGVYPIVDKAIDIERRFDRAKLAADTLRNSFTKNVAIYDDTLRKSEIYMEQLLEDFPRAIEEKEFVVYYQPKFAIQSTLPVLSSAEALVRWNHKKLGMIYPGDFIPLMESNGLICRLDSYVWREVAAQMRDWKDRLGVCVPVSVNVSRVDIFDSDLVENMQALIREFGLSPDELLLEITESAYTQDSTQIINTVKALREAGFHIEIDDFGSGYSSLNMISSLPMDALKLDMEFMRNAFKERKNTKMLDAVIDIAYSLEVPTVAEGVETAEQMFALKEMGCDIVQGFYFSKPLPPEEFERFLVEKKLGTLGIQDKEARIKAAEQFAYEALHDPLTGLYNHSAYKILLKDADQRNIALMLVDVDGLDEISQAHGEETTERVLKQVAEVLKHNFRSVDFICRIGPDEFAVILTRVNKDMKPLIAEKVEHINAMLRESEGELPPVALSIGVAFADRDNPRGDIFEDADDALRQLKNMKQNGYAIY